MLHNPENQRRLKIKDKNVQITHPGVLMQAHSSQFKDWTMMYLYEKLLMAAKSTRDKVAKYMFKLL